jgi:uncharacterized protein (DUF2062 family)
MHPGKNRIPRVLRYYHIKFKRLNDNPRSLAGGTAIGMMVGLTPTVPFHTPVVILLSVLTRTSVVAALLVSWLVFNPLTIVPIYGISLAIGNFLTPYEISFDRVKTVIEGFQGSAGYLKTVKTILAMGYETAIVMLVGGLVFSLPFALTSYFFTLRYFTMRQRAKKDKEL